MANNNDNTTEKKSSIKMIDQYSDLFLLREKPVPEVFVERMAADLIDWAINDDDALLLIDFQVSRLISPQTFTQWTKKFPFFMKAKRIALQIIGSRREKGALKNKLNANMIIKRQHAYDPDWKKDEEWRNELRVKAQQGGDKETNYTFVFEDFGEKKKKDHIPEDDK